MFIFAKLSIVSLRVSPFSREEELKSKSIIWHPRLEAAISNEILVRVLGSQKIFTTFLSGKSGSLLMEPSESIKLSAKSYSSWISSLDNSLSDVKCFIAQG